MPAGARRRTDVVETTEGWAYAVLRPRGAPGAERVLVLGVMWALLLALFVVTTTWRLNGFLTILTLLSLSGGGVLLGEFQASQLAPRRARRRSAGSAALLVLRDAEDLEQLGLIPRHRVDQIHQVVWDLLSCDTTADLAAMALPGLHARVAPAELSVGCTDGGGFR